MALAASGTPPSESLSDFSGTGEVRVRNGAHVYTNHGRIGFNPGSNGRVYIDGAGSQWNGAGDINVGGGLLSVSNGGTVIAVGLVSINPGSELLGNGTVTGYVFNAGDVRPGTEVPGTLGITGDYNQHTTGTLYIDMDAANSYDSLSVTGNITLAGTLNVSIDNLPQTYVPAIGDSFDILNWTGSLSGGFALPLQLPILPGSRMWNTSQLYTTGVIAVVAAVTGLAGDFNHDASVDAADYVVWRKTDGTPDGYNTWRSNFGRTSGSGLAASENPVPEPGSLALLTLAVPALCAAAKRWQWGKCGC